MMNEKEYRHFPLCELVTERSGDADAMKITGRAAVFNVPEVMYEYGDTKYYEMISDAAFDNTDLSDVILNVDHDGKPAARTRNDTLKLDKRSDGLYVEAELSGNATGRELYEDIKGGFIDKMSFAFTVDEDSYDRETHTRTILRIGKVYDVSCVSFPAYESTSVSARDYFSVQKELEEKSKGSISERDKLILKIKLMKGTYEL